MHDDRIKNVFYQPYRYNNCMLDLKKKVRERDAQLVNKK